MSEIRRRKVTNVAFDQHAIPNSDAMDRLLRYETTVDRNLRQAQITLERLQRHRKGEAVSSRL